MQIDSIFYAIKEYDVILGAAFIAIYWGLKRFTLKTIGALSKRKSVSEARSMFILRCFNILYLLVLIGAFLIVSGIGYGEFAIFMSSVFTILGVSFIAQWSILSNVTASFLIFFVFPYRIGDYVIIADGNDIEGTLLEIKIFHTLLKHPEGNIITYPNSLLLQKSVTKVVKKNQCTSAKNYTQTDKNKRRYPNSEKKTTLRHKLLPQLKRNQKVSLSQNP